MPDKQYLLKLGKQIRTLRIEKKMTQNELAIDCGFEKASLSRIESGLSNPTVRTLLKISKALAVRPEDLFKD